MAEACLRSITCPSCCRGRVLNQVPAGKAPWWACNTCTWQGSQGQLEAARSALPPDTAHQVAFEDQRHKSGVEVARIPGKLSFQQPTGHLICPRCYCGGTIKETLPPGPARLAWYTCEGCGWEGSSRDLNPDPGPVVVQDKQIQQALREDRKRGKKGGGSKSSGGRKDKKGQGRKKTCEHRTDREEQVWSKIRATFPRNNVVKVPGVNRPADDLRQVLGRFYDRVVGES